jgi:hypothetical protein
MSNSDTFETLIDAVAEQTGKPRGVCRSLVTELGTEIAKTVANGEPVMIEGLGRFIPEEEGLENDIIFQPSDDIEELVNAPYAHMEPEIIEEEIGTPPVDEEKNTYDSPIANTDASPRGSDKPAPKEEAPSRSQYSFKNRYQREEKVQGYFWIIAAAFIILLLAIGAWYMIGLMPGDSEQAEQARQAEVQNMQSPTEDSPAGGQEESPTESDPEEASQEDESLTPEQQAAATGAPDRQRQASAYDSEGNDTDTDQTGKNREMISVEVERGQSLWGLADNQYENPYLWPWIYDTNREEIDDPDLIYVGQMLDIPLRSGADRNLSDSDSLQVALAYVETYLWYKDKKLENAHFYLYAAKRFHSRVFEYTDAQIDPADLKFANRGQ